MYEPVPFAWNYCPICGEVLVLRDDGEKPRPNCARCRRFFYRNPLPAVCCILTRNHTDLLLARRANEPCRGEWAFPGGFIEMDETTEQALTREMQEETGVHIREPRLIGVSTQQSQYYGAVTVLGYAVQEWDGTFEPNSDVAELQFFPDGELPPLPFTAHNELLKMFRKIKNSG